jgi:Rieske Fe-S protein
MPCGNFYYATCHNIGPSLLITIDHEDQYFHQKKTQIFFCKCHMSNFNGWMKINNVTMMLRL